VWISEVVLPFFYWFLNNNKQFISFRKIRYHNIFFLFHHNRVKRFSTYWDKEDYLLEVCGKTMHCKLAKFFPDIPTMHCVAALRRENQTRRFWTICCSRPVTTNGFCRRFKVHWGSHLKLPKAITPSLYPNDPRIQSTSNITGTAIITQHCSSLVVRVLFVRVLLVNQYIFKNITWRKCAKNK